MPRNDAKIAWYFSSRAIDGMKIVLGLKNSPMTMSRILSVPKDPQASCQDCDKVSREFRKRKDLVNIKNAQEVLERTGMIFEGLRQYSAYRAANVDLTRNGPFRDLVSAIDTLGSSLQSPQSPINQVIHAVNNLSHNLKKQSSSFGSRISDTNEPFDFSTTNPESTIVTPPPESVRHQESLKQDQPVKAHEEILKEDKIPKEEKISKEDKKAKDVPKDSSRTFSESKEYSSRTFSGSKEKKIRELSSSSKAKKVPATRLGRLTSFGSLAAGLGIGAIAEASKRSLGFGSASTTKDGDEYQRLQSAFLNEANLNRIVETLCKVRGAALKLGQIISIQDESIVSPQIAAAFERVRQSADFMPLYQMSKVLKNELGNDWREKYFISFNDKPFAAASIGQVHEAVLKPNVDRNLSSADRNQDKKSQDRNLEVAVKIQYPGVAEGMESDIKNLVSIMKFWKILPDGLFIDNVIKTARKELNWEVDYNREAECQIRYRQLIKPYSKSDKLYVPKVYPEISTSRIFISELVNGIPIDKIFKDDKITQDKKNQIAERLLRLCLREVFEFRFMQTDPNFSNYLYDPETDYIHLLDFGASREYSVEFVDSYFKIIQGAANQDYDQILKSSIDLGFLTGFETKEMENAHVQSVLILGEAFSDKYQTQDNIFDFANQSTTKRISALVPVMLKHRLTPPPEETYSLHRKMSGVFLMCQKLKARINCRQIYLDVCNSYKPESDV